MTERLPAPLPSIPHITPIARIRETPKAIWFRASQSKLGREVLLKLRFVGEGASGPAIETALVRAREEMLFLSKLHSETIVAAFDVGRAGGWLYQIVELPPGEPLTRSFHERGKSPWAPAQAVAIGLKVVDALAAAHRAGIVLRRLHPEDIFLDPAGRLKIASLEWASTLGGHADLPPDPNWLAPEVATGVVPAASADVHALGQLLAWLLTGREPPASGLRRADEKAAEALRTRDIPDPITDAVMSFLRPKPEERPQSAGSAREALLKLLERPVMSGWSAGRRLAAAGVLFAALIGSIYAIGRGTGAWGPFESPRKERPVSIAIDKPAVSPGATEGVSGPAGEPQRSPITSQDEKTDEGAVPPADEPAPPTPPARDPKTEAAAKELAALEAAWKSSPEGWADTIRKVEALRVLPEAGALRSDADLVIEEIREAWRKKGREVFEELRAKDWPELLSEGSFAAAAGTLERLASRFPLEAEPAAALRRELLAKQEAAISALSKDVELLLAAGKLDEAERLAGAGSARLAPPADTTTRAQLAERSAAIRKERAAAAERIAAAVVAARERMEPASLQETAALLDSLTGPSDLLAPVEALKRELKLAIAARDSIDAGAAKAAEQKASIRARIFSPEGEAGEPQDLVIEAKEGATLTARRRGSSAAMKISLYDLDPLALESLAGSQPEPTVFKEGLFGLLLAGRRTPQAQVVLQDSTLPPSTRLQFAAKIQEVRGRQFADLVASYKKRREALAAEKAAAKAETSAGWAALYDSVRRTIAAHHKEPHYAAGSGSIEEVFVAAATETLRGQAAEHLLRGQIKERRERHVRILYDMRDPQQFGDWRILDSDTRAFPSTDGVRLSGALRLGPGDPFEGKIRAIMHVPARGYSQPPRIGVILGSREKPGKMKTPKKRAGTNAESDPKQQEKPGAPSEKEVHGGPQPAAEAPKEAAVAFIAGYVSQFGVIDVPIEPRPMSVESPANAVFSVSGTLPAEDEVFWAAPAPRFQGPLLLNVELGPAQISWSLGGRPVYLVSGDAAARVFARQFGPAGSWRIDGSVTIFTEADPVTIGAVELTGTLSEKWIEAGTARLAKDELEKVKG